LAEMLANSEQRFVLFENSKTENSLSEKHVIEIGKNS